MNRNRIEQKFAEAKKCKRKAISLFLTAGYPSLSATEKLACALGDCGVDFLEIGFPFSDPIADGATIQHSSFIALRNGVTWEKTMRLCKNIRAKSNVPLVLMSYSNPLFHRTWKKAAKECAASGLDGVILPDMIPEESSELRSIFKGEGLNLIYLLSSTSSPKRMEKISRASSGFIYCVSVAGVTGARKVLPVREVRTFLAKARKISCLPLVLGFGISRTEQLREFNDYADGYIIGSALIKILDKNRRVSHTPGVSQLVNQAKKFVQPFLKAAKR